jgi:hypothetical protein
MITALISCATILIVCAVLKHGSIVGNIMLATYFFVATSLMFVRARKNPKYKH